MFSRFATRCHPQPVYVRPPLPICRPFSRSIFSPPFGHVSYPASPTLWGPSFRSYQPYFSSYYSPRPIIYSATPRQDLACMGLSLCALGTLCTLASL